MGCSSSKDVRSIGENRPEELAKCAAVSGEVRWSWLRGRTLFTFAELRSLFQTFCKAASSSSLRAELVQRQLGGGDASFPPAPICSVQSMRSDGNGVGGGKLAMMDKAQFLSLCDASETTMCRLPEVVGAFAPRLFDVLDEDGDGLLSFETFAQGLSKLLKGPESEKIKLMYAAYDLSGVAPSEERRKSSESSRGGGGSGSSSSTLSVSRRGGSFAGGGKAKPSRRSKFLTLEDMTTVLATASEASVYPTLLSFTEEGGPITTIYRSSGGGTSEELESAAAEEAGGEDQQEEEEKEGKEAQAGGIKLSSSQDSMRSRSSAAADGGREGGCGGRRGGGGGSSCSSSARASRDPEALAQLLREIAHRNAADYAARAVSEFGHAHNGALTPKEFEKWALTGPVLRCRINEFSIDLNVAPFQGVRLA